jgi:hypothetical protein
MVVAMVIQLELADETGPRAPLNEPTIGHGAHLACQLILSAWLVGRSPANHSPSPDASPYAGEGNLAPTIGLMD